MQIISHRINKVSQLENTETSFGVEIDIRSYDNNLILHHDPFLKGELFKDWLTSFRHKTLIINIKEEGLEDSIMQLLSSFNISDYFFLDQSIPFLIRKSTIVKKRTAARYSEFEDLDTIDNLTGYISWIWIDCFTKYPSVKMEKLRDYQSQGIKICLVSPELQGHNTHEFVDKHYTLIKNYNLDAVCTKVPEFWKRFR